MTTQRTSGPGVHATKSVLTQQRETTLPPYPEIFGGLPLGIVVLQLENPKDVRSFRIVDINPAVALLTGATLEDLRGRTLAEFPRIFKTRFPRTCLEAIESRESRSVGDISYGDERIREAIYSVQVFPLPGDSWALLSRMSRIANTRSRLCAKAKSASKSTRSSTWIRSVAWSVGITVRSV